MAPDRLPPAVSLLILKSIIQPARSKTKDQHQHLKHHQQRTHLQIRGRVRLRKSYRCVCLDSFIFPSVRTWYLSALNFSSHFSVQASSALSSCSTTLSPSDVICLKSFESSANNRTCDFTASGRSFNVQEREDDWWAEDPLRTKAENNSSPLTFTTCERLVRKASIHLRMSMHAVDVS